MSRPPATYRFRFANGLTVLCLYTKNDPISAAHLFLPNGASREPVDQHGVSSLLWSLLMKGTKKKTAREIAEEIESIGASIGAGATHDYSEVSCHSVSEFFPRSLEMLAEGLFRPVFPDSEVEKEKNGLIAAIRAKRESVFTVANEELARRLFGDHPYARPSSGSEESVRRLTGDELRRWHRAIVVPKGAVLSVASDRSPASLLKTLRPLFGPAAWPAAKSDWPAPTPIAHQTESVSISREEPFEQAYLLVGFAGPAVTSADFVPLKIMNACLGGGMSARLFQTLREKEGLGYDVGSYYASKRLGTAFVVYIGLQADKIETAKRRIADVLKEIRTKRIPARELAEIKNYVRGTYILDHQTNSQRSHYLGWWETLGLGSAFDARYVDRIMRTTSDQVRRAAERLLTGPQFLVEVHPRKKAPAEAKIS